MAKSRNPLNDADFFWKNFRLGTELQISGTYIYNALYFLDTLEYIQHEEDIFELLYNISVGIERIQKIAIVMLEHKETVDQLDFEKTLLTHNHTELYARINKITPLNLGKIHTKFLGLIRDFYTTYRYGRFNKKSVYHPDYDKDKFLKFLKDELNLVTDKHWGEYVQNDLRVKRFIGKTVSTIVCNIYGVIRARAYDIGTFTYEIRYGSKAFKIFMAKEYTFELENNFKKEIIINLMNAKGFNDEFKEYLQNLQPLKLDNYNSSYYIQYLINSITNYDLINEYEYLIDEKLVSKARQEEIEPIGESHYLPNEINFFSEFDLDDDKQD